MTNMNRMLSRSTGIELKRIVEPLASYICATDQPRTALLSALAVLFREVEATNQAARSHFRSYSEN